MHSDAPPIRRRGVGVSRRVRLLVPLIAAGLATTACEVTATVTVDVAGRGGEVTADFVLDEDALGVFGAGRDQALRVLVDGAGTGELREAGWTVGRPRRRPGGGAAIRLTKEFGRPDDLGRIVEELSGKAGPLSEFRLERSRKLTGADYRLTGTLDARALTGLDNAPGLLDRLDDAGVDSRRVAELLAQRATGGFRVRVVADLPGGTSANTAGREGGSPVWEVKEDETVAVRASSSENDLTRPFLLAVAVLLAVVAVWAVWSRRPAQPAPPLG
jgi:hypothetical protein